MSTWSQDLGKLEAKAKSAFSDVEKKTDAYYKGLVDRDSKTSTQAPAPTGTGAGSAQAPMDATFGLGAPVMGGGMEDVISQKEQLLLTRQRMLQLSQDNNVYRQKVIYTLVSLIVAVIAIIMVAYVFFNRA